MKNEDAKGILFLLCQEQNCLEMYIKREFSECPPLSCRCHTLTQELPNKWKSFTSQAFQNILFIFVGSSEWFVGTFFSVTSEERCRCHNSQHVRGWCVESKYNQIKVKHGPYLGDTLHPRTALEFNAGHEIKRAIQKFLQWHFNKILICFTVWKGEPWGRTKNTEN